MYDKILELLPQILTIPQWKALILLLVVTSAITETVKRVFLLRAAALKKKRAIYAVAFVTGAVAGLLGWIMVGVEDVASYYWLMFGVIVGPLANFMHWITLGIIGWKFPGLASALKGKR